MSGDLSRGSYGYFLDLLDFLDLDTADSNKNYTFFGILF